MSMAVSKRTPWPCVVVGEGVSGPFRVGSGSHPEPADRHRVRLGGAAARSRHRQDPSASRSHQLSPVSACRRQLVTPRYGEGLDAARAAHPARSADRPTTAPAAPSPPAARVFALWGNGSSSWSACCSPRARRCSWRPSSRWSRWTGRPSSSTVDQGDERARGVLVSLRRLSTQLSAAQVGITLTTLVVGYLAEPSIGRLLAGPIGLVVPDDAVEPVATGTALVLVTAVLDGVRRAGAAVPRHLALRCATAKVVAVPVRMFATRRPAAHRRAQRVGQRVPAGDRHHASGGAVRCPDPAGAGQPGASLGRGRARSTRRPRRCSPGHSTSPTGPRPTS